jgi:hypothetical protein
MKTAEPKETSRKAKSKARLAGIQYAHHQNKWEVEVDVEHSPDEPSWEFRISRSGIEFRAKPGKKKGSRIRWTDLVDFLKSRD